MIYPVYFIHTYRSTQAMSKKNIRKMISKRLTSRSRAGFWGFHRTVRGGTRRFDWVTPVCYNATQWL